jgi:hypothetical protein
MFDRHSSVANLDASFRWTFFEHPTPVTLFEWTKRWAEFMDQLSLEAADKVDRIAYAWIYYQLQQLRVDVGVIAAPFDAAVRDERAWMALLEVSPSTGGDGTMAPQEFWRKRTLPLLARPEIGFRPSVQEYLLRFVSDDIAAQLWLKDQRRRLVTDAIIAAAAEVSERAEGAEKKDRVERAIEVIDQRYGESNELPLESRLSPWSRIVEPV